MVPLAGKIVGVVPSDWCEWQRSSLLGTLESVLKQQFDEYSKVDAEAKAYISGLPHVLRDSAPIRKEAYRRLIESQEPKQAKSMLSFSQHPFCFHFAFRKSFFGLATPDC